jgi:dTDP-4-dehydrorhamnose 3,5-epimerase-like enzyme
MGGRIITSAGELAQVVNGQQLFTFLAYIEFQSDNDSPRGNHYHSNKEEFLYIIKGKLKAVYKNLETEEMVELLVGEGDLIHIKPGCAHVYYALEYTQAIEFSPHTFDPTDTHKSLVLGS